MSRISTAPSDGSCSGGPSGTEQSATSSSGISGGECGGVWPCGYEGVYGHVGVRVCGQVGVRVCGQVGMRVCMGMWV